MYDSQRQKYAFPAFATLAAKLMCDLHKFVVIECAINEILLQKNQTATAINMGKQQRCWTDFDFFYYRI